MAALEDERSWSLSEIDERLSEIKDRLQEIDQQYAGRLMPGEAKSEWNALNEERDNELKPLRAELNARKSRVEELAGDDEAREEGATFHVRPNAVRGDDIYDLSTIRMSFTDPDLARRELRDRAMRSVEAAEFYHADASKEKTQSHIDKLLRKHDSVDGEIARRILVTGSPTYKRAFGKAIAQKGLTPEEQRALSLGSAATGGAAVVYTLDPTIVPTSNFSVNPFRAMSRIETISGTNEWKAVTSGAITAAYAAEATEASDNAPTLAQPDIIVERCQAFVPYSIELDQDWGALAAEMAGLLQDAKDDVEATKFALGAGHGSTEPKGLITAATATTTAGGAASFAIADLYKLLEALPPRFRPRAKWLGNLFTYDKVRQFDTAGGSGVWYIGPGEGGLAPGAGGFGVGSVDSNVGPLLLGRPAYESTAMASALTTGSKILAIGDFRYFVIVDRVGMNVELLPNLLGANRRPTGQRGLYAYWRNSSDVLSASAFQVLVTG